MHLCPAAPNLRCPVEDKCAVDLSMRVVATLPQEEGLDAEARSLDVRTSGWLRLGVAMAVKQPRFEAELGRGPPTT